MFVSEKMVPISRFSYTDTLQPGYKVLSYITYITFSLMNYFMGGYSMTISTVS